MRHVDRALLSYLAGCHRATGRGDFIEHLNKNTRAGLTETSKLFSTSLELENLIHSTHPLPASYIKRHASCRI